MKSIFASKIVKSPSLLCFLLLSGCANKWPTAERNVGADRADLPPITLSQSVVPGDVLRADMQRRQLTWLTNFTDWERLEKASAESTDRSIMIRRVRTPKSAFTEQQGDIRSFFSSLGMGSELSGNVSRITIETSAVDLWDIRDESILSDLLNRPYTLNGADDVIASNLEQKDAVLMLCSSAARISDFSLNLRFNKTPLPEVTDSIAKSLEKWAAKERITIKGTPSYDPLSDSFQAVFSGTISIRSRIYPIHRMKSGIIAVTDPVVIERARFVSALLR
jgi:hypothetical protein